MVQWNPEISSLDNENNAFVLHGVIESETTYSITINMTGSDPYVLGRSLGCMMVGYMPQEGLEEALCSLRDMLVFYNHKPTPRPAQIAPKAIGASIGGKEKRPNLAIT